MEKCISFWTGSLTGRVVTAGLMHVEFLEKAFTVKIDGKRQRWGEGGGRDEGIWDRGGGYKGEKTEKGEKAIALRAIGPK